MHLFDRYADVKYPWLVDASEIYLGVKVVIIRKTKMTGTIYQKIMKRAT